VPPDAHRNDSEGGGAGDSYGPIRGVLLELLGALDDAAAGSPREFYDRICRGICELTDMTRCALLLYDEREKRVLPAGSYGIEDEILAQLHGTLDETPIAATALAEDRVVITSALAEAIPARHRRLPGVVALACVPVAAGERKLGVMLCDRGGEDFEIDPAQRDLIWGLGKTVALAASTRMAADQQERAKLLAERVALARDVHDRVMQRLFGLSLVLGSGEQLGPEEQQRASEELRSALEELRDVVQRTGEPARPPASTTLSAEVRRLAAHYPALDIDYAAAVTDPPPPLEPLAQSVLAEALHNVGKHASPRSVLVATGVEDGAWTLEVRNDGVPGGRRIDKVGMGLRLAALDAIQNGGVLEFGPDEESGWRVRLVLPTGAPA
jgi:signal transduction histidine kinase